MKEILKNILKDAGLLLLDFFNNPVTAIQKESQSSIVTEADLGSEKLIVDIIRSEFPSHNILSEECGFIDNKSEYTWIIDPLDGTSNFASGIPWFGVLITLFRGNQPEMAGAYLPITEYLFFAEKGKGAVKNDNPFSLPADKSLKDSLFAFCVDYTEDQDFLNRGLETYKFIAQHSRNIRSTNSLVDFLYVAEGKFGGVLNLFTKVWDISGLGLIISEAGGVMKNINGNDIHFSIGKDLIKENFPVIAGNRNIVEQVLSINSLRER